MTLEKIYVLLLLSGVLDKCAIPSWFLVLLSILFSWSSVKCFSIIKSEVWNCQLSQGCLFLPLNFYIYFGALLLDVYIFMIVVSLYGLSFIHIQYPSFSLLTIFILKSVYVYVSHSSFHLVIVFMFIFFSIL